jgi:YD repeat-containing protein
VESGTYEAPNDLRFGGAKLVSGDGWQLKFKDGRTWRFRQIGFVSWLVEQRDANGNVLRIERNDSGRPTTITAPGKRCRSASPRIRRGQVGELIQVVRDATGREVRYAYNGTAGCRR